MTICTRVCLQPPIMVFVTLKQGLVSMFLQFIPVTHQLPTHNLGNICINALKLQLFVHIDVMLITYGWHRVLKVFLPSFASTQILALIKCTNTHGEVALHTSMEVHEHTNCSSLSRVGSCQQQVQQGVPDIPLLSNVFLLGDPEAPPQARQAMQSLQVLGLPQGFLPVGGTSKGKCPGGILNQMHIPPQLAPFHTKRSSNSNSLRMSELLTLSLKAKLYRDAADRANYGRSSQGFKPHRKRGKLTKSGGRNAPFLMLLVQYGAQPPDRGSSFRSFVSCGLILSVTAQDHR